MKQKDLKPCGVCGKGVMHTGSVLFYEVSIQRQCLDMNAVRRQHGLEQMLGSPALAAVMGPDADLAKPLSEKMTMLICQDCALSPLVIAAVLEEKET